VNGVRARITSNGNGLPVDFNSVESVNIVKGPGHRGPRHLDVRRRFHRPRDRSVLDFDGTKGSVSLTMGSYDTNKWTARRRRPDLRSSSPTASAIPVKTPPVTTPTATRRPTPSTAPITWRPTQTYELFVNAPTVLRQLHGKLGINRVTQDLIDNGNYVTGININNGATATPSDAQNSKYVLGGEHHRVGPHGKNQPPPPLAEARRVQRRRI